MVPGAMLRQDDMAFFNREDCRPERGRADLIIYARSRAKGLG